MSTNFNQSLLEKIRSDQLMSEMFRSIAEVFNNLLQASRNVTAQSESVRDEVERIVNILPQRASDIEIKNEDKPTAEIRVDLIDEMPRTSEEVIKSEDTFLVETTVSPQITEQIKQKPADEKQIQQTLDKNCVIRVTDIFGAERTHFRSLFVFDKNVSFNTRVTRQLLQKRALYRMKARFLENFNCFLKLINLGIDRHFKGQNVIVDTIYIRCKKDHTLKWNKKCRFKRGKAKFKFSQFNKQCSERSREKLFLKLMQHHPLIEK